MDEKLIRDSQVQVFNKQHLVAAPLGKLLPDNRESP